MAEDRGDFNMREVLAAGIAHGALIRVRELLLMKKYKLAQACIDDALLTIQSQLEAPPFPTQAER